MERQTDELLLESEMIIRELPDDEGEETNRKHTSFDWVIDVGIVFCIIGVVAMFL